MIENYQENLDIATGEQKERIEIVESIGIGAMQKAELVLIILGAKPATEVEVYAWNEKPDEVVQKIQATGLTILEKSKDEKKTTFVVSKNSENAEKLLNFDASVDHDEYGRLMGFPDTARYAFEHEDELLPQEEYPEEVKNSILGFTLSKSGVQAETQLIQYWDKLIKKYSPTIYSEIKGTELE